MTKDRSIVGDLINFRGLVYSPINEDGVIFFIWSSGRRFAHVY